MHIVACKLKDRLFGRLVVCILICAIVSPLLILHYLSKQTGLNEFSIQSFQLRTKLDKTYAKDEFLLERLEELRGQIDELERIKLSLSNELRQLEGKRHRMQKEVQIIAEKTERVKTEAAKLQKKASRARRDLDVLKMEHKRLNNCPQLPHLKLPKAPPRTLHTGLPNPINDNKEAMKCSLQKCFDFSRCSYGAGFTVYVYNPTEHLIGANSDIFLDTYTILKQTSYYTTNAEQACSFITLVGSLDEYSNIYKKKHLQKQLSSLPYWNTNGRNHILLQLISATNVLVSLSTLRINTGLAILAQSSYPSNLPFRVGFDIVVPPITGPVSGDVWQKAAPQLPTFRSYFLTFEGDLAKTTPERTGIEKADIISLSKEANDFNILTECSSTLLDKHNKLLHVWALCGSHSNRTDRLKKSTLSLVSEVIGASGSWLPSQVRLIEGLQTGSIPVFLGPKELLPFGDLIDWKEVAIILPYARITELNTVLRTISSEDIVNIRRQGRFIWETYLANTESIIHTTLAAIRTRLALPADPAPTIVSPSIFTAAAKPIMNPPDLDAIIEVPSPSYSFTRNLTMAVSYQQQQWNAPPGALFSFPSTPFDPTLPSSAPFLNSTVDFDLINKGLGGTGEEFSKAQGGNYAKEQFTVVIVTYERELVLMESIQRLVGLPYLNKVVIVWNSPLAPSLNLRWPDIGVPVHVIKTSKNSLNNRFIPYDVIETDAILSVDDDVELRHDEISLAFRVWRENRDRIVGFPGRYHAWDSINNRWLYVSNHSCELSLILTGAAFIHRYFLYLFTHWMQQSIRDRIDEYMNCEDIAMNFLVSHITRKPPIKVTSRWTFVCSSCPVSLWSDKSHFEERHKCINFFEKVYGYMPLLRTQYRADSVLFKTRIPSSETKCFKYV